jgi:deazaflavin-dependent oxidoreductase (nitroreductase family)
MAHTIADAVAATMAGIAARLGPRAMRVIARINKYLTNPIQRRWAALLPYMAVIEHRGRVSQRVYRTPVMAFLDGGGLSVVLNYGEESDWVRNVQAAQSAVVLHRGKSYRLVSPRIVPAASRTELHGTLTPD